MNKNCFTKVSVIDPRSQAPVEPEKWAETESPKEAEWIRVENTRYGFSFLLHKAAHGFSGWDQAVEAAKNVGEGCRLPDRFEIITLYNAVYTSELNKVIEVIGGDILSGWCWSCEEDEDPQYSSSLAWYASLSLGSVGSSTGTYPFQLRVVSGFCFLKK